MKLDKRPITTLTLDIIRSSAMWVIIYRDGSGSACHAPMVADAFPFVGLNADEHTTCYPCKPDAPFEPIPWAILPGEVEIEEWRGFLCQWHNWPYAMNVHKGYATLEPIEQEGWYLVAVKWNEAQGKSTTVHRDGFRPALRRQINADGTETPVWVWEKN